MLGSKSSCPDLAKAERGENNTTPECIGADGWQMQPLLGSKGSGNPMELWYHGSEALVGQRVRITGPLQKLPFFPGPR